MADSVKLSVILPVFAEKESVAEIAEGLVELIGDELAEIVIVIAQTSPSETFTICNDLAMRYDCVNVSVQERTPGLGFAVRQGIQEASGTHILLMDSDGEMDVETVPHMLAKLKETNADMVVGSRWIAGGGVEGYDQFKYYLNRVYQLMFRILLRTRIHDLTLGFKLARAEVMKSIGWQAQFHDIGCETTMRVIKSGCRVTEVPTVWRCRKEGLSKNPFRRNFLYVSMALSIVFWGNRESLQK